MDKYELYLHNVPKVSEDGKVVPIAPPQTKEFTELGEAREFAADHKDKFDRVVLIGVEESKQQMLERYMDGQHIVIERKKKEPEAEAPAVEAAAAEEPAAEEPAAEASEPAEGAN